MSPTFGGFLKQLRKRAAMSQRDLAVATGYSRSLIGALEQNQRLPDIHVVLNIMIPALGLQNEPQLAVQLVELAAVARGERLPASFTIRDYGATISARQTEDRHQLPFAPAELVGRDVEVEQLQRRLMGQPGRLLTLMGPPGVGKTRLAQAVGAQMQWNWENGACFIPLAALQDPTLVASTLLIALKVQDAPTKPPETRVIEYLRHKEMLLILDNFEQILGATLFVAELLAQCGGLHILVTSRERLHLRAEQRYRVQPLALEPATDLFCRRAAAVDSHFVLTPGNRTTIAAICQRLDCLPLAIELCAAQVDLLTPAQLLAHLHHKPLDLLVEGARDLPPAQRTLRAAIQSSYERLDEDERRLLRSLSVLAGGGDLTGVSGVSGWEEEARGRPLLAALHILVSKNLVQVQTAESGDRRFALLEMIRQFSLEQASAEGEVETLHLRHYTTYLRFACEADWQLRGPRATAWFARFDAEQDNVRAALHWALDQARYVDAAWLAMVASWYWLARGKVEAASWVAQLLLHRHTLGTDLRLAILLWWYAFRWSSESFDPDSHYSEEVLELLESCSVKLLQAAVWHWLGVTTLNPAQSADFLRRSVTLAREARERPDSGSAWGLLDDRSFLLSENIRSSAVQLMNQGKVEQGAALAAESLELYRRRGDQIGISDALGTLGQIALLRADLLQALELLQEAAAIQTAISGPAWLSEWRSALGVAALYGGEAGEARLWLTECLALCIDREQYLNASEVCVCLADVALHEGRLDDAEQWLVRSLAYRSRRSDSVQGVEFLLIAARLATQQQFYTQAALCFGAAEALGNQMDYHYNGPMRSLVDHALTATREAMANNEFDHAWLQGRNLALEPQTVLASIWRVS